LDALAGRAHFVYDLIMVKSIKVIQKKRGRPATGKDPVVTIRMPADLIEQVDAWAKYQQTGRSEAVRSLIELGLVAAPKGKR
jgi:hypothetical protein